MASDMSLAEIDAALRAAMDDDWDGGPQEARAATPTAAAAVPMTPEETTLTVPAPSVPEAMASDTHHVNSEKALDAALREAMDADWERSRPAGLFSYASMNQPPVPLVPPQNEASHGVSSQPLSMGYLSLPDGVAATLLVPGVDGMQIGNSMHGDGIDGMDSFDDDMYDCEIVQVGR